jgi:hypothetical protein
LLVHFQLQQSHGQTEESGSEVTDDDYDVDSEATEEYTVEELQKLDSLLEGKTTGNESSHLMPYSPAIYFVARHGCLV